MKKFIQAIVTYCFIICILLSNAMALEELNLNPNCNNESSPLFIYDEYKWGLNYNDIEIDFLESYTLEKRLEGRAYVNENSKIMVPIITPKGKKLEFELLPHALNIITKHIENALENRYADKIYFPDMGHGHFLIPEHIWETISEKYSLEEKHLYYKALFNEPEVKILYHAAEQIQMTETFIDDLGNKRNSDALLKDKAIQWRYYTRNIIGNLTTGNLNVRLASTEKFNTLTALPGYTKRDSFHINANKNGCFPFKQNGKTLFFDLSFQVKR